MQPLQRDFLPADLAALCREASVDATIAVQARQTLAETEWLLSLAAESALSDNLIRGVVGWAEIVADNFADTLPTLTAHPLLKGLRHVVQAEPEGFLDAPAFNKGIAALRDTGLVYDILVFARQLPEAIRFVDRHPHQSFVLDHIAKPSIASGELDRWAAEIRELARRPNVACKLSGMVTEADWHAWTPASLQPYFEVVLEAFTPARLMAGTDWPVMTVACSYAQWWEVVRGWLAPLTPDERAQIEGLNAYSIYHL